MGVKLIKRLLVTCQSFLRKLLKYFFENLIFSVPVACYNFIERLIELAKKPKNETKVVIILVLAVLYLTANAIVTRANIQRALTAADAKNSRTLFKRFESSESPLLLTEATLKKLEGAHTYQKDMFDFDTTLSRSSHILSEVDSPKKITAFHRLQ
jgi:hypothetical protein